MDLKTWARRGAEARVAEIHEELAAIRRAFPGLRANGVARLVRKGRQAVRAAERIVRRKRRSWSAAQRRAVSARMKKYWAARRKAQ